MVIDISGSMTEDISLLIRNYIYQGNDKTRFDVIKEAA